MNNQLARERLVEALEALPMITACCTEFFVHIRPAEALVGPIVAQANAPPGSQPPPAVSGSGATDPTEDSELHLGIGRAARQLRIALAILHHLSRTVVAADLRLTLDALFASSISGLKLARTYITMGKRLPLNLLQAGHNLEAAHTNVTQIVENIDALTRTVQTALDTPPVVPPGG